MENAGKILGGILLVSGTTIGAAILALPVETGLAGFMPTLLLFLVYWVLMTFSACLFLEVDLWIKEPGVNIISMARETLGKPGEAVSWVLYLILLYTLTTAYMAASGPLFLSFLSYVSGIEMPNWVGPLPLILIFSFFVYEGAKYVDYLNRFLMFGLVLTYIVLNFWLLPYMDVDLLAYRNWRFLPLAVALTATSFGYHIIIPTVTRYLDRNVRALLIVILIGGAVPLIINGVWVFVTLGIIPLGGPAGLIEGYAEGLNAVDLIILNVGSPWLSYVAQWFLFFAIVTSFLGVSLSLRDFLTDGLGVENTPSGRWSIYFLTFVPPLFFALTVHRVFFKALDYAGMIGVLALLVVMPIVMVWRGRYRKNFKSPLFKTPGGKPALAAACGVAALMILLELGNKIGIFRYF